MIKLSIFRHRNRRDIGATLSLENRHRPGHTGKEDMQNNQLATTQ